MDRWQRQRKQDVLLHLLCLFNKRWGKGTWRVKFVWCVPKCIPLDVFFWHLVPSNHDVSLMFFLWDETWCSDASDVAANMCIWLERCFRTFLNTTGIMCSRTWGAGTLVIREMEREVAHGSAMNGGAYSSATPPRSSTAAVQHTLSVIKRRHREAPIEMATAQSKQGEAAEKHGSLQQPCKTPKNDVDPTQWPASLTHFTVDERLTRMSRP